MIRLVEVVKQLEQYVLREVFINPTHVVSLREDGPMKNLLSEGQLPEGLNEHQSFTRLVLDKGTVGLELIVVGPPALIESKLKGSKMVLNG